MKYSLPHGKLNNYHLFSICLVTFTLLGLIGSSEQESVNSLDRWISQCFYTVLDLTNQSMLVLTSIGDPGLIRILSVCSLCALFLTRKWNYASVLIIGVWGLQDLVPLLQETFERPRQEFPNVPTTSAYAYPSGHTTAACSFYGFWMLFIRAEFQRNFYGRCLIFICWVAIFGVGISRVALLVHWSTDVVGAGVWLLGYGLFNRKPVVLANRSVHKFLERLPINISG